ncbi:MAG TPA: phage DNA ejection protein [Arsenophonus sp.]
MIGQATMDLRLAAKSGDQAFMTALQKNKPVVNQMGLSLKEVFWFYKRDPQQFDKMTDLIHLHADPKSYFYVQHKWEGREIDRSKLAETERSNRVGEALTMRGQNIIAQNVHLSREIQRAELQGKVIDRQIARETNALKLDELRQKQADVQQKASIAKADRQTTAQGAVDTFNAALDLLNEIDKSPGL